MQSPGEWLEASGLLGIIALISFLITPLFSDKLNRQFMLGARNQAFLTEYLAGMATAKTKGDQLCNFLESSCYVAHALN